MSAVPSNAIPPLVPTPPERTLRGYKAMDVPPGARIVVTILSDRLYGVSTHWLKNASHNRHVLCYGDSTTCAHCAAGVGKGWEAWLAVQLDPGRRSLLCKVTEGGYTLCPALKENDGNLRGRLLQVHRAPSGTRGAMNYVLGKKVEVADLNAEFNVIAALAVLFHLPLDQARAWISAVAESFKLPEQVPTDADPNYL